MQGCTAQPIFDFVPVQKKKKKVAKVSKFFIFHKSKLWAGTKQACSA